MLWWGRARRRFSVLVLAAVGFQRSESRGALSERASRLRCHPTGHHRCRGECCVGNSFRKQGSVFHVPGTTLSRGMWASGPVNTRCAVCRVARPQPGDGCRTAGTASSECHIPQRRSGLSRDPGLQGPACHVEVRVRVRAFL